MSQLQDEFPDQVASIQIHVSDGYAITWGENRANGYGVGGIPDTWCDGAFHNVGASSQASAYAAYRARFDTRSAVGTWVDVKLGAEEIAAQTYRISMRVRLHCDSPERTLQLHMVQVLDHYPTGARYRDCLIQADGGLGTHTLSGGDEVIVTQDFQFIGDSWTNKDEIAIIAWARGDGSLPTKVKNAYKMKWADFGPLTPNEIIGDVNNDCVVDLTDLGIQLLNFGASPADPNEGDINDDDIIDLTDLGILLLDFGTVWP